MAIRPMLLLDEEMHRGGGESSGSEHESHLSALLDDAFFPFEFDDRADAATRHQLLDDEEQKQVQGDDPRRHRLSSTSPKIIPSAAMVRDLLNPLANTDRFRADLLDDVTEAVDRLGALRDNRSAFRRAVMSSLRDSGHNAGICKSRWSASDGITAGSYEYVDVVRSDTRYVVDVDFAGELMIARPTEEYERLAAELPRVLVARVEDLKAALRVVAEAVKRSLRSREMHVPPWRKPAYLQAKWLGSYKRTTNAASSFPPPISVPPPATGGLRMEVQCRRSVGFQAAPPFVPLPTATRLF